jgi:hypothetical protein
MTNDDTTAGDSKSPKRGAIPTPRSEIDRAKPFVPDDEHVDDHDDGEQGE